jgi:acetyl esterase
MGDTSTPVILEPAAQALAEVTSKRPFLFQLPLAQGRLALEALQSEDVPVPVVEVRDLSVPGGPAGDVPVRVVRPEGVAGLLPAVVYLHGNGWVFGGKHTHDRLIRELCAGSGAVIVFPSYDRSPEARYPAAVEQGYAVLNWLAAHGSEAGIDSGRIAVAGDSAGGNIAAALTLTAKERCGLPLAAQLLFYPVTDARFDTPSYQQFAEGYYLRRDGMQWLWNQYTRSDDERAQVTASPLRATLEQLRGLPPALVITGEADVLRDEGEAYASRLRQAGVPVTGVRYQGIIHDFVMLNALRGTCAAEAAISQATAFLKTTLARTPVRRSE